MKIFEQYKKDLKLNYYKVMILLIYLFFLKRGNLNQYK